jgi:hypothetical protein
MSYPCYQVANAGFGAQLQYIPQCNPACAPSITPYFPNLCGPTGPTGATGATGGIGPTGDKTFIIDHPTDSARYLVHGCLEGPEVGVYYRGKGCIEVGNEMVLLSLPDYVDKIGTDFSVQITPIFSGERRTIAHEVSEVCCGQFVVYGPPGKFFWHVYAKRSELQVEPLKSDVELKGDGPYKWM